MVMAMNPMVLSPERQGVARTTPYIDSYKFGMNCRTFGSVMN